MLKLFCFLSSCFFILIFCTTAYGKKDHVTVKRKFTSEIQIPTGGGLKKFFIDKYLVTFEQYDKFCEEMKIEKPSDQGWGRGKRPVINVNWFEAQKYCKWVGKRLPTSAELEWAVRDGTKTEYFWGDTPLRTGSTLGILKILEG